jgi:hypothetical protein
MITKEFEVYRLSPGDVLIKKGNIPSVYPFVLEGEVLEMGYPEDGSSKTSFPFSPSCVIMEEDLPSQNTVPRIEGGEKQVIS